jgi:hypothetical protein
MLTYYHKSYKDSQTMTLALCASLVQALATTRVNIRPAGAMRNEGFVVQAGGMGGMVQRTFSGGPGIMGCFDWFWNDG